MTTTTARRLVLASSPAVGPLVMARVADALRRVGATVSTPHPHAELSAYVAAASEMAKADVLAGYSGAGPRLFAVARALQPRAVVFIDAGLPADGVAPDADPVMAALLDRLPIDDQGRLPPWPAWWADGVLARLCPDPDLRARFAAECPRLPRKVYSEPIPAPPFAGPCGFLALGESYADERRLAEHRGWPTATVPFGHLAPLTEPDAVSDALLELTDRLLAPTSDIA